MENQKANAPQVGDDLKQMFADYQKKSQQTGKKKNREDLLKKYFIPRNTSETFRILPAKPGKRRYDEAFFHVVPTIQSGGKKKHGTVIYCAAHNDPKVPKIGEDGKPITDQNGNPVLVPAPCPLCAEYKKRLAKQDPSIKGIKKENMNSAQLEIKERNDKIYKDAIVYEAKKFYIFRGIDKGAEKDGVKFWRFKHNYKNQGTLDKLLPILNQYVEKNQADYADPINGTNLSILMTDSEFNGRVYKAISGIIYDGKSPLHNDPLVARAWLEDDITWRDVFLPKKAPGITPYEYLEMTSKGQNPYWDETDPNNKRWVFPGHPDLEEAANTRTRNLDADENDEIEQASDLNDDEYPRVTISNITEANVGTYKDDAVDLTASNSLDDGDDNDNDNNPDLDESDDTSVGGDNYDDLPF